MQIWVDADACPVVVKEVLFRAAERLQVPMTLVANQWVKVPASKIIRSVQVPSGFDVADNYTGPRHLHVSRILPIPHRTRIHRYHHNLSPVLSTASSYKRYISFGLYPQQVCLSPSFFFHYNRDGASP